MRASSSSDWLDFCTVPSRCVHFVLGMSARSLLSPVVCVVTPDDEISSTPLFLLCPEMPRSESDEKSEGKGSSSLVLNGSASVGGEKSRRFTGGDFCGSWKVESRWPWCPALVRPNLLWGLILLGASLLIVFGQAMVCKLSSTCPPKVGGETCRSLASRAL